MDPILELPYAIRILPEEKQGPALVAAIHERKRQRDLPVLSLDTAEGGREHLLQMIIFGESTANWHDRTIQVRNRTWPWRIGGKKGGKSFRLARAQFVEHAQISIDGDTVTAWQGINTPTSWMDEHLQLRPAATQDRHHAVREIAEKALEQADHPAAALPHLHWGDRIVPEWPKLSYVYKTARPTELGKRYQPGTNGWLSDWAHNGYSREEWENAFGSQDKSAKP